MGRKARIAGWILTLLIALFLIIASGVPKFVDFPGKQEMFDKMGWSIGTMKIIGVIEIAVAIFFALPRVGFVGTILLTGYLGGAAATHARVGELPFFPIGFGILAWVALGLRHPDIFRMAMGQFPERRIEARGFEVQPR